MRQTSDAVALFEQFLADERVAETPSAVEVVHVQMREGNSKEILQNSSLRECEGCSVAKGLGKSIGRTTSTRADKIFGRLLVEICEETSVESIGGKRYMLLICGDFSHFT